MNGVLELRQSELATAQKHTAIRKWADTLVDVNTRLFNKVSFEFRDREGGARGFYDDDDMDFM